MILVTGAAGKTGQAVLKAIQKRNVASRALVRNQEQADSLSEYGITDALVGDLTSLESIKEAMNGISSVYHICPNMHPAEEEIGRLMISTARENNVEKFVFHSVLHPQTEKMPHHWQKLRVEEALFESGLDFVILQPAPYMQNILAFKDVIINQGVYHVPYPPRARMSLLDLDDLGQAAAAVLTEPGHSNAIYEIVGTGPLTQEEIAGSIGNYLKREIRVEEAPLDQWRLQAKELDMDKYQLETLSSMFEYYAHYGLVGNNNVLQMLLGRSPNSLDDFIRREFI